METAACPQVVEEDELTWERADQTDQLQQTSCRGRGRGRFRLTNNTLRG